MAKNILIAAGGTGGHLFPAMAVGDELIRKTGGEIKLHFIGTENRIESQKVPKAGFHYTSMPIKAFPGKSLKAINWFLDFRKSIKIAKKIIKQNKIDALICAGAYLSVPPGFAAKQLGIPVFLMESNVNLGKAHRILLKNSNKIFISWKETYSELSQFQNKAVLTGNPVRKSILSGKSRESAKTELGFDADKPLILVVGGSLGAESINNLINKILPEIIKLNASLLWQTGGSFEEIIHRGIDLPSEVKKVNFIDDMGTAYSAADLVISRSGATAVSEICVCGATSILVPLSSASNNEQMLNAKNLANNKSGILIPDNQMDAKLLDIIKDLINNDKTRKLISDNAKKLAKPNAAESISRVIMDSIY